MNSLISIRVFAQHVLLLAALLAPCAATAATWNVKLGAQVPDCLAGGDKDAKLAAGCQARQMMALSRTKSGSIQDDAPTLWFMFGCFRLAAVSQ
jgi:hypothetical protein